MSFIIKRVPKQGNGEKSLPVDVTPNTQSASKSKSTLTNTPSTSKNLGNRSVSNRENFINNAPCKIDEVETKKRLEERMMNNKKSNPGETNVTQKR